MIVKSRMARSSSIGPGSGVKSTVRPASRATRQAPCRSESGKGAPPERFAYSRAAPWGSRQATSRSMTSRPSSSSRTAPPTIHASSPARISRASSSIEHDPPRPRRARVDAADELVVDRVRNPCVLLDENAVPDERDRRADRQLADRARPPGHPWRRRRRRGGARRRRAPRRPSCRAGNRRHSPRGRSRSSSPPPRRTRGGSPCSRPARAGEPGQRGCPSAAQARARPPQAPRRRATARRAAMPQRAASK